MKQLHLVVFTPEGKKLDEMVDFIQIHTSDSFLGILPSHAPLIADVKISRLLTSVNGVDSKFAVGEGMFSVKDDEVKVIVDTIEHSSEIDIARAMDAKKRAEERLDNALKGDKEVDVKRAEIALSKALNRIAVADESSYSEGLKKQLID